MPAGLVLGHGRLLQGGPRPGLPALIPTQGNLAFQLPQFYSGSHCFVCWPWGRGLLPSPVEPEPRGPIHPLWSGTALLPVPGSAGGLPGQASQTRTGCGPAPRALAPCHHPLVALGRPLMPTCSCSSPHPLAGHAAGVSSPGAGQGLGCGINTF